MYVALHEVMCMMNGCTIQPFTMHVMYTERDETAAVSRGTSHVTTKQRCKYTTSVDTQKRAKNERRRRRRKKATVTHLESHATKVQRV